MTLKKKILTGYGVAFSLMGLVFVWSVANLVSLGKASDAILNENYKSILAAENMVDALERQDSGILLIYLGESETGTSQFRENEALFLQWLARAKDNITITGEADLVREIEAGYRAYRYGFSQWTDLKVRPASYRKSVYPLFTKVRDACIGLRRLNEDTMYAASVKAGVVANRAIWSTSFVAGAALVVALIFSLFLAEKVVRPIRGFMAASRKISAGNYAVQVPVETGDELGSLAREFNEMATKLLRYHEMNIEQIISEKNKGEAILSSIEDGLVVFDIKLNITSINPAAREMLGMTLAETVLLQCTDILPDSNLCDLIRETIETGSHPSIPEDERMVVLTAGNRTRHCLFSVTAILGKDRHLSGIVLLLRDVTRLKEVEQLKSEFVMAASHELRTPLTSLGMSVDLLLEHADGALKEKDHDLLWAAHEEVLRMKALVNDLLDLSKIEAGRIEMEYDSVRVATLFDHVRTVFKGQLDMQGVDLVSQIPGELPRVRADANKITWVLTNLVSNALRYVGRGGRIALRAQRIGPNVHLSVQD
ncbi:histidine kinase dimerization/phospho-acceptor domain-containing protein, partial [Desulfobacter sp.]|uniref:sensor histidine kinase n=1 Tax=Desulfobacter sp. TaxID=2294 RepID=UPI003D0D5C9B